MFGIKKLPKSYTYILTESLYVCLSVCLFVCPLPPMEGLKAPKNGLEAPTQSA